MGFKKIKKEFSFADVVLESSKKNNRSIQKMRHLNIYMAFGCQGKNHPIDRKT